MRPNSLHQLCAGRSRLEIERVDTRPVDIMRECGWGYAPIERVFCAASDLPKQGCEVRVASLVARVLDVDREGHPTRVRFTLKQTSSHPPSYASTGSRTAP